MERNRCHRGPAMNQGPGDPTVDRRAETTASSQAEAIFACPTCGTKMPASRSADRCPVCQLRGALDPELESELTDAASGQEAASPGKLPIRFHRTDLIITSSWLATMERRSS